MTPAEKQKLLAEVLAWVNEVRAKHDLRPLRALRRGDRRKNGECPIAKSLLGGAVKRAAVGSSYYGLWDGASRLDEGDLPKRISLFVGSFDRGEIPELDWVAA